MCRAGIDYWLHPLSQNTFSVLGSVQHQPPRSTFHEQKTHIAQRRMCRSATHIALVPLALAEPPPGRRLVALLPVEGLLSGREQAAITGRRVSAGSAVEQVRRGRGKCAAHIGSRLVPMARTAPRGSTQPGASTAPYARSPKSREDRGSQHSLGLNRDQMSRGLTLSQRSVGFSQKHFRIMRAAAWPRSYQPNCFTILVEDLGEQVDGGEVVDDEAIQNGRRRRCDAARRSGTQRLRGGDESRARRGEEREEGAEPRHFFSPISTGGCKSGRPTN